MNEKINKRVFCESIWNKSHNINTQFRKYTIRQFFSLPNVLFFLIVRFRL